MKVNDFSFHDATILEVRECSEQQKLVIYIDFPVDWEENKFEPRKMVFTDVTYYCVTGFPFIGQHTILEIEELNEDSTSKVEINTNAGKRVVRYGSFELTT